MNHHHQLLQSLYSAASGKYLKYKARFDKAIHSGRFYKLNKRKQSSLISRLKRLYERLKSLQTQLRIAGAGAALALTLSVSNPLQAQSSLGPFERNDALNPFPAPIIIDRPRPAVVDIDNDGDIDVFVGKNNGDIEFFRNDSPQDSVTRFVPLVGSDNPLDGVNKGYQAALAFADVDKDGDFDMLLGVGYGYTFFFRNTGTKSSPNFIEQTGLSNPFNGIRGSGGSSKYSSAYSPAVPVFVQIDGTSDVDLFIGSSYTSFYDDKYGGFYSFPAVKYYQNDGTAVPGVSDAGFNETSNFLADELYNFNNVSLAFADIDGDGDLDAFVGSNNFQLRCFRNDGSSFIQDNAPWDPVNKTGNPMKDFYFNYSSSPSVADFDGDGDLDMLVAEYFDYDYQDVNTNLRYFENTDGNFTLADRSGLNISPFGGVDVGEEATPVFVDLDTDGDLDAVMGEKYNSRLSVFINKDGEFYADPNHPLVNILEPLFNYDVTPVFADIDNDGDQDLFAGMEQGIYFFRNDNGTFVYETSPLEDAQNLQSVSLALIDVDNDSDLDALIGNYTYSQLNIVYYQNDGSATSPNFIEGTPPSPFDDFGFEENPNLFAVDLDHDGDTDLIVSETYYNGWYGDDDATRTWFFENIGNGTFDTPSLPIIVENTPDSFTSYADIDGDGDLDAFIGNGASFYDEQDGKVFFFENTNPPPVTSINTSTLDVVGNEPIVIDPTLTIEDSDGDDIVRAIVSISDFVAGEEELGFTDVSGIVGEFDVDEGVLTFIGRASIANYQTLLRSVTFNYTGENPGGRKSNAGRVKDLAQDITFQVLDTDFTLTTVSVVSLNIIPDGLTEIEIFNAVSPNKDDDANAFFRLRYIESVSPENKVTIYNRWGDVVYEVSDYDNTNAGKRFNGTSEKGKDLPSGTYFYKIEITGKTITGYLSLKR